MITAIRNSRIWRLPRTIAVGAICMYQHTLSPDHGPLQGLHPYGYCRHHPTCSDYGKQVITQRGLLIGVLLTCKRILGCNPWVKPSDEKLRNLIAKASQ